MHRAWPSAWPSPSGPPGRTARPAFAGAAGRIRRGPQRPVTWGCRARQPPRTVGFRPKGAAKLPPRNGESPEVNPAAYGGSPWLLFPSRLLASVLAVHGRSRQARRAEGAPLVRVDGLEPSTSSSLSGNAIYRLCFRIFTLNCCAPFILVRWCPSLSAAIVTQLVTHAVFFSGMLSGGLSLISQPLSNLFLGGRHGAGQSGSPVPHAVTNPARHRVRRWRTVNVPLDARQPAVRVPLPRLPTFVPEGHIHPRIPLRLIPEPCREEAPRSVRRNQRNPLRHRRVRVLAVMDNVENVVDRRHGAIPDICLPLFHSISSCFSHISRTSQPATSSACARS